MDILSLFVFVGLALFSTCGQVNQPAWNGHTTPGSTTLTAFTPYYVPPGAKSYDSSSPLVHYSGRWTDNFSAAYVQKTLRWTSHTNASISFTFTGTGIEWFGNSGRSHGLVDVFIDGKHVEIVDAWSSVHNKQQRIFSRFDLSHGKHSIKLVNTGKRPGSERNTILDLDAFVVTKAPSFHQHTDTLVNASSPHAQLFIRPPSLLSSAGSSSIEHPQWSLVQKGTTGVHAMQLAIVSSSHAIIIDKVEHNPLSISGHPAWAALYNLNTHTVRPLSMQSNSFCAGGTFLSNGTMINVGGNPIVSSHTAAADFGDLDGLQGIRLFEPCDSDSADGCEVYENHARIRMASPRWYNTVLRISDGSAMIIGGSKKGGWINNSTVNNPTIEYFPPKSIHGSNGMPIRLPFLVDTLNSNLFPIAFSLPDGTIFMAANRDAMIYNWQTNTERRLPQIPNGVRVTYPMTGTALLLPLSPENNYQPEILLCGGSSIDDTKPGYQLSSQDTASSQCSRMVLTNDGISAGWQVEQMPEARTMPDAVLLPTGQVFIVNGAGSGISGYGNVMNQVGTSNADNPVLSPVLYNPSAPYNKYEPGGRFSSNGMQASQIPRLYHSVATLTPNGDIMVAGSNPNLDRSEIKYGTEYRVEWFGPPYLAVERPSLYADKPEKIEFGQSVHVKVKLPSNMNSSFEIKGKTLIFHFFLEDINTRKMAVALMDLGYVTHAVHANSRLVYLAASLAGDVLTITGPPNGNVYPPGPGWLYIVAGGVPSKGMKVMVGDGKGPIVDNAASEKYVFSLFIMFTMLTKSFSVSLLKLL